jgi:hypothetical protein
MKNLWRDVRFGFRLLRKNPGFATVAVLALALGIGANTAIYSIVYATLLEPLLYCHPNEIVMVWSKIQGQRNGVAAGDYLDWKRESTVFQGLAAWTDTSVNLATASHPEQAQAWRAGPGFYTVMGQSTGRCNTIQCVNSTLLPRENYAFGCIRSKRSQGSVPAGQTLVSDFGFFFNASGVLA